LRQLAGGNTETLPAGRLIPRLGRRPMLTQKTLVEIHEFHLQGESIRAIAQKLGVSRNCQKTLTFDKTRLHSCIF
jgi:hypothetical protein